MGHMNWRRIKKRIGEELKSTVEIAKVTSFPKAVDVLLGKIDIQIMVHNGRIEHNWIKKQLMKKHAAMNEYFSKDCGKNAIDVSTVVPIQDKSLEGCIWICWWQGVENAPEIVKRCVDSIKAHAGSHKVIIITDENYHEYIEFPKWIEEKRKAGVISKTHISDLLRLSLLAKYGGVWLDSTFYCCGDLELYFNEPVWSIKRPDYRHVSVSCGYFANYSFGCDSDHRYIFAKLLEYLLQYWKRHDYMIDYLFLDYLIVQALRQEKDVQYFFEQIMPNNPKCDELLKVLGKPYSKDVWNDLCSETQLFKLTWKANFPVEIQGEETFYGRLLNGLL